MSRTTLNEQKLSPGMNDINEGYDPHMMGLMKISKKEWDSMSTLTITRCWVNSSILPTSMAADIRSPQQKKAPKMS